MRPWASLHHIHRCLALACARANAAREAQLHSHQATLERMRMERVVGLEHSGPSHTRQGPNDENGGEPLTLASPSAPLPSAVAAEPVPQQIMAEPMVLRSGDARQCGRRRHGGRAAGLTPPSPSRAPTLSHPHPRAHTHAPHPRRRPGPHPHPHAHAPCDAECMRVMLAGYGVMPAYWGRVRVNKWFAIANLLSTTLLWDAGDASHMTQSGTQRPQHVVSDVRHRDEKNSATLLKQPEVRFISPQ